MPDLVEVIVSSEKRKNLLILLESGPKSWDEIKTVLNVTSTGMLPQIKILEEEGLIQRVDKKLELTPIGYILTTHMDPFIRTVEVFAKHKKFWQEHLITVLPDEILLDIRDLGNYRIIENTDEEIFDVDTFLENISRTKTLKGLSHIVHPKFPDFFMNLPKKDAKVSLIFTPGVLKMMREKYPGWIRKWLSFETTSLYVTRKDIKFSFVVTDSYFSISLFYNNGIFDSKNDVISHDPSALAWGERIYTYLLTQSEKIDTPD
jgi:predicted transcriptional regulator